MTKVEPQRGNSCGSPHGKLSHLWDYCLCVCNPKFHSGPCCYYLARTQLGQISENRIEEKEAAVGKCHFKISQVDFNTV